MILYSFCYTFDKNPAHRGAVAHTAKHPARHRGLTWFDVNATSDDKTTSGGRVHCQHPVPVTTELFCSRARPRPGALLTGLLQLTTTTAPTAWWRCCWLHLRCDCERMRTLIKNRSTTIPAQPSTLQLSHWTDGYRRGRPTAALVPRIPPAASAHPSVLQVF